MDGKIIKVITAAAVVCVGVVGYNAVSDKLHQDPVITGIEAKFVGEIGPGEKYRRSMFEVKGVTEAGKLVPIKDYVPSTLAVSENGSTCEVDLTSQGFSTTVIVNITREPEYQKDIGYPKPETAQVTYYKNGDLEFTGTGDVMTFGSQFPWSDYEYTHVYLDEALNITDMNEWFQDNEFLVYCDDLPKSVKTIKNTFAGCTSLTKSPNYFQCSELKIMDYAFAGCGRLETIDTLPVNVSSAKYTFSECVALMEPADLTKTSNIENINGIHSGCISLRKAPKIPESVTSMSESFMGCRNIQDASKFPDNVQYVDSAYADCKGLVTGASIPESAVNISECYANCSALCGTLEINSDTSDFKGFLLGATANGDKLKISGNSGNLLAIQKDSGNKSISLENPEAAAQQNERMLREQEE